MNKCRCDGSLRRLRPVHPCSPWPVSHVWHVRAAICRAGAHSTKRKDVTFREKAQKKGEDARGRRWRRMCGVSGCVCPKPRRKRNRYRKRDGSYTYLATWLPGPLRALMLDLCFESPHYPRVRSGPMLKKVSRGRARRGRRRVSDGCRDTALLRNRS